MIESARYTESGSIIAVIDGVQMTVPDDMGNRHRQLLAEWEAEGNTIEPYVPPPPTVDDVIVERARRLALGFDYDFGDARGVHHIGTTENDMRGWDEVTKFATALLNAGDTTTTIGIVTDTGPAQVTASEWNAILIAAGQFRQPIWHASFLLQQMDPIPEDYADDSYWLPSE